MRVAEAISAFESLPLGSLSDMIGAATPLVLAPHADDESLGCGGLIAAACASGRPPVVAIITDGAKSHPGSRAYPAPRLRAVREREAAEATARLGLPPDRLHFLGLPDSGAPREGPKFAAAVGVIERLAGRFGCGVIAATWLHDPHCDHEAVQLMARAAARRTETMVLSYPVWGWLRPPADDLAEPPIRGWRLDIAAHLDAKRHAIAAHVSQAAGLIVDDPDGFTLPPELLQCFARPYEVYLRTC